MFSSLGGANWPREGGEADDERPLQRFVSAELRVGQVESGREVRRDSCGAKAGGEGCARRVPDRAGDRRFAQRRLRLLQSLQWVLALPLSCSNMTAQ